MKLPRKRRAAKSAKAMPAHMQDVAFTKRTAKKERTYRARKLGRFGAGSPVRQIAVPGKPETAQGGSEAA